MMDKKANSPGGCFKFGSDVAAETTTAMEFASLVFCKTDSTFSDIDQSCTTIVSICRFSQGLI